MKFLIDLELDGYLTEEERKKACIEFIKEQLNMTASSIKVLWVVPDNMFTEFNNAKSL